ncbi:hypothetical protein J4558_07155 [Leptolyngbya sp. 15MV]|nr:hypothetical protein J4558_07155 [Leptolyngbya sp. 15MV]
MFAMLLLAVATPLAAQVNHAPPATASLESLKDLIPRLREGRHVLLVRHERTEIPSRDDDYSRSPGECPAQRNLSVAGAAGAEQTGRAIRALGIPIREVIASPMCRGWDTARWMFGNARADARLMHHDPDGARTLDIAAAEIAALLTEIEPLPGGNVVLISHAANIFRASGERVPEGGIVILRHGDDRRWHTVGRFSGTDLESPMDFIRL